MLHPAASTRPQREAHALPAAPASGSTAVLPIVYDELRRIAADFLHRERRDHTLQATALVHEVFLRLAHQETAGWTDREQFFRVAGKLMRRILIDHARARNCLKRGTRYVRTPLDDAVDEFSQRSIDLDALAELLDRLERLDARKSRIVELRFFCGLTAEETAGVLNVPLRTVERDWSLARAWLRAQLSRP